MPYVLQKHTIHCITSNLSKKMVCSAIQKRVKGYRVLGKKIIKKKTKLWEIEKFLSKLVSSLLPV